MAFCSNCGANLDGKTVCPQCGAPAGQIVTAAGDTPATQSVPQSDRSKALAQLDDVITYFGGVEEDYALFIKEYDELNRRKKPQRLPGCSQFP